MDALGALPGAIDAFQALTNTKNGQWAPTLKGQQAPPIGVACIRREGTTSARKGEALTTAQIQHGSGSTFLRVKPHFKIQMDTAKYPKIPTLQFSVAITFTALAAIAGPQVLQHSGL